jgi:hypothetical protein
MEKSRKQKSDAFRNVFMEFKTYPVKVLKKKIHFEQHFIVPWEMMKVEHNNSVF